MTERQVHLVSQEGESFDVPLSVAVHSELVKTMVDGKELEPATHFCEIYFISSLHSR